MVINLEITDVAPEVTDDDSEARADHIDAEKSTDDDTEVCADHLDAESTDFSLEAESNRRRKIRKRSLGDSFLTHYGFYAVNRSEIESKRVAAKQTMEVLDWIVPIPK